VSPVASSAAIELAEKLRIAIAAATTLLLAAGLVLSWRRRPEWLRRTRSGLLAGLALGTVLVWWFPYQAGFGVWFHPWDAFHYYVGAKYFRELGYTRLYECAVTADVEAGYGTAAGGATIRNLETNRLESARPLLTDPDRCKRHFSEARWRDFSNDVAWFRRGMPLAMWLQIRTDHGYNAPPAWGLLGWPLTNAAPASTLQLWLLTLIDPLLVALMFGAAAWAFGWRTMCVALIFWGTNQTARWEWVGGSILRYDWLAASVGGICCLRRGRPALGGVLLAYATCLRVFPAMLAAAVGLAALTRMARDRAWLPTRPQRRFAAGFVAAVAVLVAASSWMAGGLDRWGTFVENSRLHVATATTNLVGLPSLLSFQYAERAEVTLDPARPETQERWQAKRAEAFARRLPVYLALGLASLALVAAAGSRSPDWVSAVLGVGLIPVFLELSGYYLGILLAFAFLWTRHEAIGTGLMLLSSATWLFPCLGRDCDLAAAWFSGLILVFVAFATLLVLRPPAAEGTGLRSWA
jgi:hypothetical protein